MTYRIATHDTHPEMITNIGRFMSVGDLFEAHEVLDAIDDARRRQAERARRDAEKR